MSDTDNRQDLVKRLLDTAAQNVGQLDPERWPGFGIYFLEVVDAIYTPLPVYRDCVLRTVQDAIDERLTSGRW